MHKLLAITLLLIGSAPSCTTIAIEPDAPVPTVSYQQDVAPIIAANCAQTGCHGPENAEGPNLLSYTALSGFVVPNKPHSSRLYNVIRLYDGSSVMPPKPNQPLSDVQLGQIYVWISQGATDN